MTATVSQVVPPPQISTRPGASDWAQIGAPVFDGDYVTLRNLAWKGSSIAHTNGSREVFGRKIKGGALQQSRLDNVYSLCIRKVIFNAELKAFVLPSLQIRARREPISKTDYVLFISPDSVDYVLGTRQPPHNGNNGDYRVELIHFPLITQNHLNTSSAGEKVARLLSLGMWNNSKDHIDFLAQAAGIWTFHTVGVDNTAGVVYGGRPMNIRNIWTEVRAKETEIWEALGPIGPVNLVSFAIHKTFNGGRNLTQAAGSDGKTIKLALSNNDRDDKAGWIVDAWNGNHYPVQRVIAPVTPPPPPPEIQPGVVAPQQTIPDLTELIRNPDPPRPAPGLSFDPETQTNRPTQLERLTQEEQNKRVWWELLIHKVLGVHWSDMGYPEQLATIAVITLLLLGGIEIGVSKLV